MNTPIMLIHGAWLTPRSWDRFRTRYESKGLQVETPAWPMLDRSVGELRRAPDPRLGKLGVAAIADHYAGLIRRIADPPILIGHSFGGLVVQLLLDRGLGAAGVAIDPAPPFGVLADPVAVRTSLPVFTAWNGWNRALTMDLRGFSTGFAQTLPCEHMADEYVAQIVPAPGRIFFQALLGFGTRVTWESDVRPPLLLIAGENDRTVPAAMVRANARLQRRARSRTDFQLLPGRSHYLCNEPGWEEVADLALGWSQQQASARAGARALAA